MKLKMDFSVITTVHQRTNSFCAWFSIHVLSPLKRLATGQTAVFLGGVLILQLGLLNLSQAQTADVQIACVARKLLQMTEGNAGALLMVCAGIMTIISSAFGAYKAAINLLAVAIGSFILRSLVDVFYSVSFLGEEALNCGALTGSLGRTGGTGPGG